MHVRYVEDLTSEMVVAYLNGLHQRGESEATISSQFRILLAFLRWAEHFVVRRETIRRFRPYRLHVKQNVHIYSPEEYAAMCRVCDELGDSPLHGRLTPNQVKAIRVRFASGETNRSALARAYQVSETAVRKILAHSTDGQRRSHQDGHWWKCMIACLYGCGLRLGEAQHLVWSDVRLNGQDSVIYIREHKRRDGLVPWRPKGRLSRIVPVPPDVHESLSAMKRKADPKVPYVFLSPRRYRMLKRRRLAETQILVHNVLQGVQRIQRLAGTYIATLHELRHSFVTRWATRVPPPVLQLLAGHQDIKTTLRIYTHLRQSDAIRNVQRLMWQAPPLAEQPASPFSSWYES